MTTYIPARCPGCGGQSRAEVPNVLKIRLDSPVSFQVILPPDYCGVCQKRAEWAVKAEATNVQP